MVVVVGGNISNLRLLYFHFFFFSNISNAIEVLGSLSGGEENNVTYKIFVAQNAPQF